MSGQSRRQPVRVELGKRTAYLSGPGVYDALTKAEVPRMRCPVRRVWCCSITRVDDVLAVIEHVQGRRFELVETAVRTDPTWPSTCRVVRGTLLALAAEMRPDGVVRPLERHVLAFRVGLPVRTLNRHLRRAVEMGWLSHRRGQKYVSAEYRAAIPDVPGCQVWPAEKVSQDATRGPLREVSQDATGSSAEKAAQDATWWPAHIDRASVSEHVAVDNNRERRDHHDGTRALGEHDESQSRDEVKDSTTPVPVAAAVLDSPPTSAPANVNRHPATLGKAVEPDPYESVVRAQPNCRWCEGDVSPRTGRCALCRNPAFPLAVPA